MLLKIHNPQCRPPPFRPLQRIPRPGEPSQGDGRSTGHGSWNFPGRGGPGLALLQTHRCACTNRWSCESTAAHETENAADRRHVPKVVREVHFDGLSAWALHVRQLDGGLARLQPAEGLVSPCSYFRLWVL